MNALGLPAGLIVLGASLLACHRDRPVSPRAIVPTRLDAGSPTAVRPTSASEDASAGLVTARVTDAAGVPAAVIDPSSYAVPADRPLPIGCFAWSARTETAACTVGAVGHNIEDSHVTARWDLALRGPHPSVVALTAGDVDDNADAMERALPPAILPRVRAALASGGFVSVLDRSRAIPTGVTPWAQGAAFRWTRARTSRGGDNEAPTWTEALSVRWDPRAPWTPLEFGGQSGPQDSTVRVALLPGDRFALVTVETHIADEGVGGTRVTALRCDQTRRRCE